MKSAKISLLLKIFVLICCGAIANPFESKIPRTLPKKAKPKIEALVYKGFISVDNQKFAFIRLDKDEFEVTEGETVKGYKIIEFNKLGLDYQVQDRTYRSLLVTSE